ncbi:hypothetical protein C7W93_11415 [Glaciimonas sp. PCH181]|nr:hypothetical protein C7W93_11415 [Glaciimonas sp. PCH181]
MLISDLAIIPIVPAPADMWASVAAKKKLALTAQVTNEELIIRVLSACLKYLRTVSSEILMPRSVTAFAISLGMPLFLAVGS